MEATRNFLIEEIVLENERARLTPLKESDLICWKMSLIIRSLGERPEQDSNSRKI
jgi:hypothetical protein